MNQNNVHNIIKLSVFDFLLFKIKNSLLRRDKQRILNTIIFLSIKINAKEFNCNQYNFTWKTGVCLTQIEIPCLTLANPCCLITSGINSHHGTLVVFKTTFSYPTIYIKMILAIAYKKKKIRNMIETIIFKTRGPLGHFAHLSNTGFVWVFNKK